MGEKIHHYVGRACPVGARLGYTCPLQVPPLHGFKLDSWYCFPMKLGRFKTLHLRRKKQTQQKHTHTHTPFGLNGISEVVGMLVCDWDGFDLFIFSEARIMFLEIPGKWPAFKMSPCTTYTPQKVQSPKMELLTYRSCTSHFFKRGSPPHPKEQTLQGTVPPFDQHLIISHVSLLFCFFHFSFCLVLVGKGQSDSEKVLEVLRALLTWSVTGWNEWKYRGKRREEFTFGPSESQYTP